MTRTLLLGLVLAPLFSGCLVRAAADVVTAPIKVATKTVDLATTSQSEADEKRGRALRERDERIGKLSRKRDRLARACQDSGDHCGDLRDIEDEISAEVERPL